MITVEFDGDVATVTAVISGASRTDVRTVLLRAADELHAAMKAPVKSNAEIEADVRAEIAARISQRPVVTVK